MIELEDHPFFVASQFHPEFKSRPERPAPLFRDFIAAALERAARGTARCVHDDVRVQDVRGAADRALPRPVVSRSVSAALASRRTLERRYLSGTFAELCRIESPSGSERACAERVIAELRALGRRRPRGRRGRADGLGLRQPARADPRTGRRWPGSPRRSVLLCAHLDTVPLQAPVEPVLARRRWENANEGILGADNKAASRCCWRLPATSCKQGAPVDVELLFTVGEEVALAGSRAFDAARLRSDFGYVFDHASPIGEVIVDSPTPLPPRGHLPGRGRARGHPPRGGPQRDPRGRARDRLDAARAPGRAAPRSTSGTIAGGSAMNVVPERCTRRGARCAASTDERAEALVAEIVDRMHEAANLPDCDCDVDVSVRAHVLRLPAAPERARRWPWPRRRCAPAGTSPCGSRSGGGSDANALIAAGLSDGQPRQRHRAQPRARRAGERGGARGDARRGAGAAGRGGGARAGRGTVASSARC